MICDFNRRAKIIFGVSQDNSYSNKLRITILAVGCGNKTKEKKRKKKTESRAQSKLALPPPGAPVKEKKSKTKGIPDSIGRSSMKSGPKIKAKQSTGLYPAKPKAKKKPVSKKIKVKPVAEKITPPSAVKKIFTRKSALDLKKEAEKIEKEILEAEEKWSIPAFLRRQEG